MNKNCQDEVFKAWEEWIEHWKFSNQTSFRVAAELKRATDAWLWSIRDTGIEPSEEESVIFVRHRLLSEKGEKDSQEIEGSLGRCASLEFTQSTYLAQLFTETDAVPKLVQGIDDRIVKLAEWLEDPSDRKRKELWEKVLTYLRKSERELHEYEVTFRLLENPAEWKSIEIEQRPNLFGNLFLAFSLLSHKGFLADNLNEWHLSEANDGVAKRIQSTLGYLLHTKPHTIDKYPEIEEALAVSHDGKASTLLADEDIDRNTSRQNHLSIFAGIEVNNHHDVAFDLTWMLFGIFNKLNKAGKDDNIYHFVVPVYAWSAPNVLSGHDSVSFYHHAGALLGWAFYRFLLPGNAPPPHFWPDDSGLTKPGLTQALDRLAVSMESFAKDYLSGETEWALERPWHANDTAILFMKRNFIHSCGWDCKEITPIEQDCYFKSEEDSRLRLVNLTRQIPRGSGGGKRQALIATLAPNSLCILPEEESVRNTYLGSLVEHARYFYERCLYIQETKQAGRVSVSHSLQFAVSVQLQKMQGVADAIHSLRSSTESFPISSFAQLPDELRRFHYPVELYSTAVLNALEQESGSNGFARLIPVVDWMDRAVEHHGFNESFIRKLANDVARPLARISLRRRGHNREPLGELQIQGGLPKSDLSLVDTHENRVLEGRILIAAMVEALREAYHHCGGEHPIVTVTLQPGKNGHIRICNSFSPAPNDASLIGGNQRQAFSRFQKHLPSWKIIHPQGGDGMWVREFTKIQKQP